MTVNNAEIVFPGTNIRSLLGTYGAANTTLPAPEIEYDGVWPAGMADLGYSKGGASATIGRTVTDEYFDQAVDPVESFVTQREIMFKTVLGQVTADKLIDALGYGSKTTVAAATGTRGYEELVISNSIPSLSDIVPAFEIKLPSGFPMRTIFYRAQVRANLPLEFKKEAVVTVPFEARALPDTVSGNVMKIQRVTTAAL